MRAISPSVVGVILDEAKIQSHRVKARWRTCQSGPQLSGTKARIPTSGTRGRDRSSDNIVRHASRRLRLRFYRSSVGGAAEAREGACSSQVVTGPPWAPSSRFWTVPYGRTAPPGQSLRVRGAESDILGGADSACPGERRWLFSRTHGTESTCRGHPCQTDLDR